MKFLQISFLTRLFPNRVTPALGPVRRRRRPLVAAAPIIHTAEASDPQLLALWLQIRNQYFPERADLDTYAIVWSRRRQKRVLAACDMNKRIVRVANELRVEEHARWLEPLIYHEMCHAVLGANVSRSRGRRMWHGREFKALERLHPEMKAFDHWIKTGGWLHAVRSARSRAVHQKRQQAAAPLHRRQR